MGRQIQLERLQYIILLDDDRIAFEERIIVRSSSFRCIKAAWPAAIEERRKDRLFLRQGARILERYPEE